MWSQHHIGNGEKRIGEVIGTYEFKESYVKPKVELNSPETVLNFPDGIQFLWRGYLISSGKVLNFRNVTQFHSISSGQYSISPDGTLFIRDGIQFPQELYPISTVRRPSPIVCTQKF